MISVFFYCSSPYVGYKLKQVDYVNREMLAVTTKEQMTNLGYTCFTSSGSYTLLGSFEGKRYFHTRQSKSENYDEQGRRIYTNIAFLGSEPHDEKTVNKIAAYAFFKENEFYETFSKMITLEVEGFSVDFDELSAFIDQMENCDLTFSSEDLNAQKFYDKILTDNQVISFIVTEASWDYFVKQTKGCFSNNRPVYSFTFDEAQRLISSTTVELSKPVDIGKTDEDTKQPEKTKEAEIEKTEEAEINKEQAEKIEDKEQTEKVDKDAAESYDEAMQKMQDKLADIQAELLNVREKFVGDMDELEKQLDKFKFELSELQIEYDKAKKKNRLFKKLLIGAAVLIAVLVVVLIIK